jgi:hypothetical protein
MNTHKNMLHIITVSLGIFNPKLFCLALTRNKQNRKENKEVGRSDTWSRRILRVLPIPLDVLWKRNYITAYSAETPEEPLLYELDEILIADDMNYLKGDFE